MCGICGFNFEQKSLLVRMCDLIEHRGPNDFGYYLDSNLSIGMRRLSIIDLKTGHQPQHNETEDIWIVYNGEIYNFLELREKLEDDGHNFYSKSDTEVIIHAYEKWGFNCVKKLRGPFAFCIYDKKKKILFLARDHLGLKPLYYFFDGENFIFASEIKCILIHNIKRVLNKKSLNLYLSLRYVPFQFTLFEAIYKLNPSSYLIFNLKKKKITITKYWDFNFESNETKSIQQIIRELKILLEESVKLRLISDVPLGAFLSGGIDSSSVVGIMCKLMDKPVKTYSIGFEEGAPINETRYAKIVADYCNTEHTELLIKSDCYKVLPLLTWHLDDLIADPATIPYYYMAKMAKEKITVALTGDGADEIFGGYSVYYQPKANYSHFISKRALNSIMRLYNYIPSQTLKILFSYLNLSKTAYERFLRGLIFIPDEEKKEILPYNYEEIQGIVESKINNDMDIINQYINWDLKYQLPSQYNMKVDKMSMAASFESRVPFLDKNLIEWATGIPANLKLRRNIEKYILRIAMKDIIPKEILMRKKTGFNVPVNLWLKTGFKEFVNETLKRLEIRKNLIDSYYIQKIRKHQSKRIYEIRIWILLMFELWYETFIENEGLKPIKFDF